ncbi:MAG: hypothetical protein ABI763_01025 [Bacteroidota bacterium]
MKGKRRIEKDAIKSLNNINLDEEFTIESLNKLVAANDNMIESLRTQNESFRTTIKILRGRKSPQSASDIESSDSLNIIQSLHSNDNHDSFPKNASLLDQCIFYQEHVTQRFWCTEEINEYFTTIFKGGAEELLKYLSQKLYYYLKTKDLYSFKYAGNKFNTFYCSNRSWITNVRKEKGGELVADIVPGHEPLSQFTKNLTNEQKSPKLMTWSGLTQGV